METLLALILVIREGNPRVTIEPHPKVPVIFSMTREKADDQTVEFYMIWDIAKLMSRHYIGAWAGLMRSILIVQNR